MTASVRLTNPEKLLFADQGLTKRALADYLLRVAERMLPHLRCRPLTLVRCPEGTGKHCFFQKHYSQGLPAALKRVAIAEASGKTAGSIYVENADGLVGTAQIGALELHVWGARVGRLDHPDRMVFDLDPDPELPFDAVKQAAGDLRASLAAAGLASFPLLTGGKGIHVVVPLTEKNTWAEVKLFAEGLARRLEASAPQRFVASAAKAKRRGRIFIDWLRNERGATAVAPYSVRARSGAPVALPVAWDELAGIESASAFDVKTVERRMSTRERDPWEGYASGQRLTARTIAKARLEAPVMPSP